MKQGLQTALYVLIALASLVFATLQPPYRAAPQSNAAALAALGWEAIAP